MYTIEFIKEKAIPVAVSYGIKSMSLFGSYARGEANEDSDVDLLIDKGDLKGLIQYFSFVHELENTLNCHVDVVTTGINDKNFLNKIIGEEILLYEKGSNGGCHNHSQDA